MIIPPEQLKPDTLVALIEDWMSRQEQSWAFDADNNEQIIDQVTQKLNKGELLITWDEEGQSLNILDKPRYELYIATKEAIPDDYD